MTMKTWPEEGMSMIGNGETIILSFYLPDHLTTQAIFRSEWTLLTQWRV